MSTTADAMVDEYCRRLEELYEQMREWLREAGLTGEEQSTALHEERSGQYQAPGLRLHPRGKQDLFFTEYLTSPPFAAYGDLRNIKTSATQPSSSL